ncbi:MAG: transposase [Thermoleophilia bacterium]|nr:transposase [Thermoleophilia bacterium]
MPRQPRVHVPNGIWHVTQRATDAEVFFRVPADYRAFLQLFERAAGWARWIVHDYCLMTNHVHLLIQTPLPTLPAGMQRLLGPYVEEFNERHGRRGALVQGRYKARLVETEEHYLECLRYFAHNPVAAGLCDAPEEWPWCAHAQRENTSAADVWGPGPDMAGADVAG